MTDRKSELGMITFFVYIFLWSDHMACVFFYTMNAVITINACDLVSHVYAVKNNIIKYVELAGVRRTDI